MTATSPDFAWYRDTYHGALNEDAFTAVLGRSEARIRAVTGRTGADVPDAHADAWKGALCALCDRAGGIDRAGELASESVGSTSLTYSQAQQARTDWDACAEWLGATGLLCAVVGDCPGCL